MYSKLFVFVGHSSCALGLLPILHSGISHVHAQATMCGSVHGNWVSQAPKTL